MHSRQFLRGKLIGFKNQRNRANYERPWILTVDRASIDSDIQCLKILSDLTKLAAASSLIPFRSFLHRSPLIGEQFPGYYRFQTYSVFLTNSIAACL